MLSLCRARYLSSPLCVGADMSIVISDKPLELCDWTCPPHHGAEAEFRGVVRNHHGGRSVVSVTYDIEPELCRKTLENLIAEATQEWGKETNVFLAHRFGRINVGEASVLIRVSHVHRKEAFEACRYVIEELKRRAPIWKKEHYVDGESAWLEGHSLCQH